MQAGIRQSKQLYDKAVAGMHRRSWWAPEKTTHQSCCGLLH